jgi:hypothetical protein
MTLSDVDQVANFFLEDVVVIRPGAVAQIGLVLDHFLPAKTEKNC